ncbi:MAG: helix-turn-helix transcriptional regulator [Micromonosporaceae bacterium]|nr:helix-turn-helix transcriptional regulator [Micromonosporaceae bacterium]
MVSRDEVLDALGDRTRREILECLRAGPQPVGVIAQNLTVGRPAVSQHLKVLKLAGLVSDEAVGTRRVYRLNPEGLQTLEEYVQSFWSAALLRYRQAARRAAQPGNPAGSKGSPHGR